MFSFLQLALRRQGKKWRPTTLTIIRQATLTQGVQINLPTTDVEDVSLFSASKIYEVQPSWLDESFSNRLRT